jgi:hypothetical protein
MCQFPVRCYLVAVLFIFSGSLALAQTSGSSNPLNGRENDPYSKYGIGDFINGNNTVLRGMGNATSAYANPYQVNTDNPASYSFLQRTTFEMGATASTRTINGTLDGAATAYTTGTATLSYLNIGIPVSKHAGMCLGFRPYTRTFYQMHDSTPGTPIGEVVNLFSGEGSLNYGFIGGAANWKGFSLGFNFGYLFGTTRNTTAVVPIDTNITNRAFTAEYTNYTRVGGLYWKGGAMYQHKLDSNYSFRIGGTVTLGQNVTERLNALQMSSYALGDTIVRDTVDYLGEQRGRLHLPLSYSIGIMLVRNDKWGLTADYSATQWSGFNSTPDTAMNYGIAKMSNKISFGAEYTPNINDIRNYWAKVTYRLGAYYGTNYLNLNNTALPFYGITAGASLPFRRSLSHMHFAFDVGRLGTTANNLLQETYVRFTIGFSFNDRWFIPHKYD